MEKILNFTVVLKSTGGYKRFDNNGRVIAEAR